jgi:thioredoxin-related protein
MKRVLLLAIVMMSVPALLMADGKKKKATTNASEPAKDASEIHWITSIDELQAKMKENPKKVYIDVYTDWCGWCKKMDASTFRNPALVKYMNTNFYALKLDAERKDTIHFMGKEYHFEPQYRANTFAVELLKGQMSYPTTVIMAENFQNPVPISGYLTVQQIEPVLSYFGDNAYRRVKWEDYQKTYKLLWGGETPDMTPPAAH